MNVSFREEMAGEHLYGRKTGLFGVTIGITIVAISLIAIFGSFEWAPDPVFVLMGSFFVFYGSSEVVDPERTYLIVALRLTGLVCALAFVVVGFNLYA